MVSRVHQVSLSSGGVPKLAVTGAMVHREGMAGDHHDDLIHHGGAERALCLFSLEVIERFQAEGHPIAPGCAGENLTISGLDWADVIPGTRLRLGADLVIEVTSYTAPCSKNARWFSDGDFRRMSQSIHPGESRVYARVLEPGMAAPGDPVLSNHEPAVEELDRL